jgi:hypothetical protein
MVDAGPKLTPNAGLHVKNIADAEARSQAQIASQGPTAFPYQLPTIREQADSSSKRSVLVGVLPRPGTFLLGASQAEDAAIQMPAAALSCNVGGMGVHWTCACPRPGDSERISFIPEQEWDSLCNRAERLLCVTTKLSSSSEAMLRIRADLRGCFNPKLAPERPVDFMPLACRVKPSGEREWSGPEVVLGPLANPGTRPDTFLLMSDCVCLRIVSGDKGAQFAILKDRHTGKTFRIKAAAFVLAADTFRIPQLLWASGIRPRALGHFLNDQPQTIGAVRLRDEIQKLVKGPTPAGDATLGVLWVPFHAPGHPFHGQVMHLDTSPIPTALSANLAERSTIVGLGWFSPKELRFQDYVEFSDELDFFDMPQMRIHYGLSPDDQFSTARAKEEVRRAAKSLGSFVNDQEPFTLPAGSSLHYQGTVRMGELDDEQSVCDPYSQVWGTDNVFVGGNGVIPTSTACNPTLSSVALAIRSCERIADLFH